MSAYLNLVLNKKILATTKVGDGTHDALEQAERMISNLDHFINIEEGRHEIIDLPAPVDRESVPEWITPLRLVTTAEPPRGRKIKDKRRVAPDRWIGIRDHYILIDRFTRPFAETLNNAFVEGRDVYNDSTINELLAASFDAFVEHWNLPVAELVKAFVLPAPYAWRLEKNSIRIVRESEGSLHLASDTTPSVTLH
ncbi:hypothetical protein [Neorhizobium sp. DAR64861/K0K2]|uniref:hypothetical protein n=1 Tax=unclassified Neorhizobium TaxID=2629175 RepID=UPI003D2E348E